MCSLAKLFAAGCLGLISAGLALGQTTQQDVDEAERQAKIAKAKLDKADAEKKLRDLQAGGAEVKALEGKTTVDDKVLIEANILAHDAMAEVAKTIATRVRGVQAATVAIYNGPDTNGLLLFRVFEAKVQSLLDRYQEKLSKAGTKLSTALLPLGTAAAALRSFIDLTSLFRTDTEIKGVEVTIQESALVAEVARHLTDIPAGVPWRQIKVYYPAVFSPGSFPKTPPEESRVLRRIDQLLSQRNQAQGIIDSKIKEIAELKAALAKAKQQAEEAEKRAQQTCEARDRAAAAAAKQKVATLQSELDQLESQVGPGTTLKDLIDLNAEVDKFVSDLTKVDEKLGTNLLTGLIRAEGLTKVLDCSECYVLYLNVQKSGGSNVTKKNLVTTLFTGDNLTHTGGTVISYMIFDKDGLIRSSANFFKNNPRTKNGKIKDNLSRANGDGSAINLKR